MVDNHGDRKSPKDQVVPLPNGGFMAYKWGVTNHLLTGITTIVGGFKTNPSEKYHARQIGS